MLPMYVHTLYHTHVHTYTYMHTHRHTHKCIHKETSMSSKMFRRAARFVTNIYSRYASVTEMLSSLEWPKLSRCRNEQKAIMLFKIINHHVDINATDFLILISNDHNTRGHSMRFSQLMTRVDSYKFSFFPSAIKIWNSLPQHVIDSSKIEQFKHSLAGLAII